MAEGSENIPSKEEQKRIISSLPKERKVPMYLVSEQWYYLWESYVGIKDPVPDTSIAYPGPITSGDLPVHEDVYRYLAMWYGISSAKLNFISRQFGTNSIAMKSVVTLFPPPDHNMSIYEFPCVKFYLPENVGYIEGEFRRILQIPSDKKSRVWIGTTQTNTLSYKLGLSHDAFIWKKNLILHSGDFNFQGDIPSADLETLRSMFGRDISVIQQITFPGFSLEMTDERGTWPSGIPGDSDITSSIQLVNFNKNRPEALQTIEQLPYMAIKGLCEKMQGNLAEILKDAEKRNIELAKDLAAIRHSLEGKLARVEVVGSQLAEKRKQMLQLEENLCVEKDAIMKEREDLQTGRDSLNSEIKIMEEINKIQEDTVTLDVGGHKYRTSILTLTKDANSMLSAMFSGRHSLKQSQDGSYFLDRDGTHFRYVLNYLRDGGTKLKLPDNPIIVAEIKAEAEYYQLDGLVQILSQTSK